MKPSALKNLYPGQYLIDTKAKFVLKVCELRHESNDNIDLIGLVLLPGDLVVADELFGLYERQPTFVYLRLVPDSWPFLEVYTHLPGMYQFALGLLWNVIGEPRVPKLLIEWDVTDHPSLAESRREYEMDIMGTVH